MGTWSEEKIVEMLNRSPLAVERAIVAIYKRQTPDEKTGETTVHRNAVGFSAFDARFGTWLAQEIKAGRPLRSPTLQEKARRLATKYRKQLAAIANASGKPLPIKLGGGGCVEDAQPSQPAEPEYEGDVGPEWCPECKTAKCPDGCCCAC